MRANASRIFFRPITAEFDEEERLAGDVAEIVRESKDATQKGKGKGKRKRSK